MPKSGQEVTPTFKNDKRNQQKLKEDAELKEKEEKLRRIVFNAIVALSDAGVDRSRLLSNLPYLDVNSWMEVAEERFIGKLCGFPLCDNFVQLKQVQKYRIDRRNRKIFEKCTDMQKYCCEQCFLMAASIRGQLPEEPLWITGPRLPKEFHLDVAHNFDVFIPSGKDVEIVKESFVAKMNELTIGESSETDVESEEEDKDNLETETDDEAGSFHGGTGTTTSAKAASSLNATKEETYESIQSSTAVSGCTVPMDSNESMLDMSSPVSEASQKTLFAPGKPKVGMKMKLKEDHSNWSEEKKLAFLRERAAKIRRNIRQPIIVHARPIVVDEKDSSVADEQFETFSRVAREWCGRETISFVETKRATRFSEGCCDEKLINELLKRFYAGDRKPTNNEDWKLISLPLVDNVDVLQKRRRILNDCLRRSWHILENYCCLTGCSQRAYDLIATFNLTADNAGLDRDISRFAVAFIFRLMGLYDSSVEAEFFPSPNSACSKFHLYIKSFKCDLGRLEKLIEEIFAINCIS